MPRFSDGSQAPLWIKAVPFILSAILFLSAFFAVFSPLPLLVLHFRVGRKWVWLAGITNGALVALAGGWTSLALYVIFSFAVAVAIGEGLSRRRSLEQAAGIAFAAILLTASLALGSYALVRRMNPVEVFHQHVEWIVDTTTKGLSGGSDTLKTPVLDAHTVEELKQNLQNELPATFAVFSLVLVALNIVLTVRLNPARLRERLGLDAGYLRRWRAPEFLVWPTILTGFCVLFDFGSVSAVAAVCFQFLMAVYALQGLSILSFFLDLWKIQGVLRLVAVVIALSLMMPLVLSLGFFDLWFDFRSKFRQS